MRRVERFVEKPSEERAREFIDSGYLWNSGNFVFRADVMLEELARFEPEVAAVASQAVALADKDLSFIVLDREFFARAPKISIDYAVMERTHRAAVLAFDEGHTASTAAGSRSFLRPRPSPELEGDRQRIDADRGPPGRLIAVAVQLAVMKSADWDCVFVTDSSAERARLREANVVRFGGCPATNDAGLEGDELAVLLVAQANVFRGDATPT